MLINEAVEAGASRSAIKPEHHRILGGASLGDHKVVEELPPMVLIYSHKSIPRIEKGKKDQRTRIYEYQEGLILSVLDTRHSEPMGTFH